MLQLVSGSFGTGCARPAQAGASKNPQGHVIRGASEQIRGYKSDQAPGAVREERWLLKNAFGKSSVPVSLYFAGIRRKLMSYNAENYYAKADGNAVKKADRIQALADVILDQDPDVIALQEVGDKDLLTGFNQQYLQGRYPVIVTSPTSSPRHIGVAFLCKPGLRVVQMRSHGAGLYGSVDGKRDLLEVTFETDTGYRFTILNIHCKSMVASKIKSIMRPSVLKKLLQQPNAQEILEEMHAHDERQTLPTRMVEVSYAAGVIRNHLQVNPQADIFITGDFNSLHDTPYGKQVLDVIRLEAGNQNPLMTEVMLKDGKAVPTHGASIFPASKLDYTFVSQSLLKRIIKAFVPGKFDQYPWQHASDHLPLVTEFEEPDAVPLRDQQDVQLIA